MPVPEGIRLNVPGEFGENLLGSLADEREGSVEEAARQLWREWPKYWALGERGQVVGDELHHQVANVADGFWGPFPASPGLWSELEGCILTHDLPPWLACGTGAPWLAGLARPSPGSTHMARRSGW